MSAAEELEDPERAALIEAISRATSETPMVDSATWACLWLSDIENLRGLVSFAKERPKIVFRVLESNGIDYLRAWTASRILSIPATTPTTPTTPSKRSAIGSPTMLPQPVESSWIANKRSDTAENACAERDSGSCIIEKVQDPVDKCHIFPSALGKEPDNTMQRRLWAMLEMYWSPTKIEAWQRQVTGPALTEHCANLICLTPSARRLWEKARFALKPFEPSEDKKKMQVQFFWMPTHQYSKFVRWTMPPSIPSDLKCGNLGAKLWNGNQDKRMISGDMITITTENPDTNPLPSFDLLQMQWILHRLVAISGAADVTDEELEDEDEASFGDLYHLWEQAGSPPFASSVSSEPLSRPVAVDD
ncbi:hypothetical protein DTO169E5_4174 [Paecilomyces variotii]|nr:hypothetical protein DTO169E5_4174 [Paecilomyces variotii]